MPVVNSKIGNNVKIWHPELVNIYGAEIGDDVMIGAFVEIQKGVKIGKGSRIQSHTFLCEGVEIGENVFVGHGVMTINDRYPTPNNPLWISEKTIIEDNASIGSHSTLLPVRIGKAAVVGAGAVVTKDVPAGKLVVGNPAKEIKGNQNMKQEERLDKFIKWINECLSNTYCTNDDEWDTARLNIAMSISNILYEFGNNPQILGNIKKGMKQEIDSWIHNKKVEDYQLLKCLNIEWHKVNKIGFHNK